MSFWLAVLGKGLDTVVSTMRLFCPDTRYTVLLTHKHGERDHKAGSLGFVWRGTLDRVQGIYC